MQTSETSIRNPFDLLSSCFMIQQHQKKVHIDEIVKAYKRLSKGKKNLFETHIGRGNAYYNNYQFAKAEKEYFKALKLRES
jgi:Flp pilus assembly protein TadD